MKSTQDRYNHYLEKYQRWPLRGLSRAGLPHPPLYIVLPAYDEPKLNRVLESLMSCDSPRSSVHIVIVLNGPQNEENRLKSRYDQQSGQLRTIWNRRMPSGTESRLDIIQYFFEDKWAGVGSARKAGTDEVIAAMIKNEYPDALIAFLDADCTVANNYFEELDNIFRSSPDRDIWSIYFEHPLDQVEVDVKRRYMAAFELHLRYYRHALRWCGFPYAYHTIGSCMAFRAKAYAKYAGMNRKKAGEDFYFFQKIASHGSAADLTDTTVYPAARLSERTPFGTGRAIAEQFETGKERHTFAFSAFEALRPLYNQIRRTNNLREITAREMLSELHPLLVEFLNKHSFAENWGEHKRHTSGDAQFRWRFYQWMGGFRIFKWLHHARNRDWPDQPVTEEALKALRKMDIENTATDLFGLLEKYRGLDRNI